MTGLGRIDPSSFVSRRRRGGGGVRYWHHWHCTLYDTNWTAWRATGPVTGSTSRHRTSSEACHRIGQWHRAFAIRTPSRVGSTAAYMHSAASLAPGADWQAMQIEGLLRCTRGLAPFARIHVCISSSRRTTSFPAANIAIDRFRRRGPPMRRTHLRAGPSALCLHRGSKLIWGRWKVLGSNGGQGRTAACSFTNRRRSPLR